MGTVMWSDEELYVVHKQCVDALRYGLREVNIDATKLARALRELLAFRAHESALINKHGLPKPFDGDQPR